MTKEGVRWMAVARGIPVWILSGIVFIAVLELCIRLEDRIRWGGPVVGAYSFDAMFGADSLGWRPRPGAGYQKFHINSFGFRGPEITPQPADGVIRVVVLGASESFGQAESRGNEYPRALEASLNAAPEAAGRRFEVINAAIPGMSVARMEEYWARWVGRFHPHVVVVYPSPGFYLDDNPPSDSVAVRAGGFPAARDESRLRSQVRTVIRQFLPGSLQSALKEWTIRRTRTRHGPDWVWTTVPEDRLRIYSDHLRRLAGTLSESGADVFFATHVSAISEPLSERERQLLVGWERFHPRAEQEVILAFEERANELLRSIADSAGAGVIEMARSFPDGVEWFSDHQHFTDAGADVVAALMARSILGSRPWGPAAGTP